MLSMYVEFVREDLDSFLPYVVHTFRGIVQGSTRVIPFCALYGQELVFTFWGGTLFKLGKVIYGCNEILLTFETLSTFNVCIESKKNGSKIGAI